MLQQRETRLVRTRFNKLLSGEVIAEEGIALVYAKENGETVVKKSTGVNGEIFAGVSQARNAPPAFLPIVQEGTVAADHKIQLLRTPTPNQMLLKVAGVQVELVSSAPADATEAQLSGTSIVLHNSVPLATSYVVQYMYTPTVLEARQQVGDAPIGGLSTTPQGVVGTLVDAQFATNMYDASVDWHDAFYVKTAPGGTFTVGTVNDHIPNAIVKNAPSGANAFLVLSIQVA